MLKPGVGVFFCFGVFCFGLVCFLVFYGLGWGFWVCFGLVFVRFGFGVFFVMRVFLKGVLEIEVTVEQIMLPIDTINNWKSSGLYGIHTVKERRGEIA